MAKGIPITAYVIRNALGDNADAVFAALRAGHSGVRVRAASLDLPFEVPVGFLLTEPPALPVQLAHFDSRPARLLWMLVDSIAGPVERALARWGKDRVAFILGTSAAGSSETQVAYRSYMATGHAPAGFDYDDHVPRALLDVGRARFGFTGPSYVVSTACSSSAKVFGVAQRLLKGGICDAALVGGVDTLCQLTVRGFQSLSLLSKNGCRPFAQDRDGTSLGEGGALLLLERDGDGPAQLLGVGESQDAFHMTAPHPEGLGAIAAMRLALEQAGLAPLDVDYANAHGTATLQNDAAEALAFHTLFADRVPVSSTKGFTGHTLGAGGATEAVFSIMAIQHGWIPPNLGAGVIDPAFRIQVAREPLHRRCRVVLSNSFAFGGNNASVIFGAAA
jgi:3-oxoacyl-[acyl-carrier-protein] synthase-1